MDMSKLSDLRRDIHSFFSSVKEGDLYLTGDPKLEKKLQLNLYRYLRDKGYLVVYELQLPNLQQYLKHQLNEAERDFCYEAGSLRPDLVVHLDDEGYACFELKYKKSDDEFSIDGDKCRVYVEHCLDVHYAGYIDLFTDELKDYDWDECKDKTYKYSFFYKCDQALERDGIKKSSNAYSIKNLWADKAIEILEDKGEFAKYGE